jgi:hypothetical protein
VTCILVPFLKQVVGDLVSKAKRLNGPFVTQRFRVVAKKKGSKSLLLYIFIGFLITATKVSIFLSIMLDVFLGC